MARQSEEIKKHQNTLRSDASGVKQMLALWTECLKADSTRKSLNLANPKAMEQSHSAVRAKIQKAPSATNVVARLTPSTSALPMMPSAVPVGKNVTTSMCAMQVKLCMVLRKRRKASFSAL